MSRIFSDGTDIWLYSKGFKLRIGCGGAISSILNANGEELLSPSYKNEKTDRIIQWTIWSETLKNMVPLLPAFEYRFNVTQGGDFVGNFSGVRWITYDSDQIDVYATSTDNWKLEQQKAFGGGCASVTRYRVSDDGFVHIRRMLTPMHITYQGQAANLGKVYLEAWTPFNNTKFNALALSFEEGTIKPLWWYNLDNIPTYPNLPVEKTQGVAVAFHLTKLDDTCVAFIFGKKNPMALESQPSALEPKPSSLLNTMSWNTGFGILPGVNVENFVEGSYIITDYTLALSNGLTSDFLDEINNEVERLALPLFYANKSMLPLDCRAMADKLAQIESLEPFKSDNLGQLLPRMVRRVAEVADVPVVIPSPIQGQHRKIGIRSLCEGIALLCKKFCKNSLSVN